MVKNTVFGTLRKKLIKLNIKNTKILQSAELSKTY